MSLSPLIGRVLQGSLGCSLFSVSQKGPMLSKFKNMVFCILLCMFVARAWDLCGSQSIQWLVSAGFSLWLSFFQCVNSGKCVEIENYVFVCTFLGSPVDSLWFSVPSGWVLQGSLGGSLYQCIKKVKCYRI